MEEHFAGGLSLPAGLDVIVGGLAVRGGVGEAGWM